MSSVCLESDKRSDDVFQSGTEFVRRPTEVKISGESGLNRLALFTPT